MLSTSEGRVCIVELIIVDLNFDNDRDHEHKVAQNQNIE
jgi:hypothetical protein